MMRPFNRTLVHLVLLLCCADVARAEFIIDLAHPQTNGTNEAVLFPFDNYALPFRKGLEMSLLRSEHTRAPYNPVLVRGNSGAPDSFRIGRSEEHTSELQPPHVISY